MRRLFWFGIGLALGVVATRKVNQAAHAATPAGIGENVGEGLRALAGALGEFGADVRAGMAEREHELRDDVQRRTGHTPGRRARGAND
ncbi:hypothetical protein GCM10022243_45350 [Saccharothrix violaceirubra]|uniref:Secreted protein n=1 Tax=Saccharothrix violaceirubra TaxID=413306 RepID=A0A7W7T3B4_9PSEU|nr:hypothetical protein [Saccharothrix violaceirubra]MBB4964575.1 hypothetical protein [Saccharothrix violaceirubra]